MELREQDEYGPTLEPPQYKVRAIVTSITATVIIMGLVERKRVTRARPKFFLFFVLPTLPTLFFLKIEKKCLIFFHFIFVFPSDSYQYSTGVQFDFSTAARLVKLSSVTAPGEILPS